MRAAAILLGALVFALPAGATNPKDPQQRHTTADTRLPEDVVDADSLISVVGNLVDNALESVAATRTGSGWIEVTIRDEPEGILLRVHDSGPGIDPALAEEIFEDGFTTKVAAGANRRGLGLALVQQTVRRRGGYVKVENAGGAVFTAFLPRESELTVR